jgi:hypothetical protein
VQNSTFLWNKNTTQLFNFEQTKTCTKGKFHEDVGGLYVVPEQKALPGTPSRMNPSRRPVLITKHIGRRVHFKRPR